MLLPFLAFWVLLFLGREELGCQGVLLCIAIWTGLLIGFALFDIALFFVAAQAIFDVVLILMIFGGDIRIR